MPWVSCAFSNVLQICPFRQGQNKTGSESLGSFRDQAGWIEVLWKGNESQPGGCGVLWETFCSQISHSGQWPIWILDQPYPQFEKVRGENKIPILYFRSVLLVLSGHVEKENWVANSQVLHWSYNAAQIISFHGSLLLIFTKQKWKAT